MEGDLELVHQHSNCKNGTTITRMAIEAFRKDSRVHQQSAMTPGFEVWAARGLQRLSCLTVEANPRPILGVVKGRRKNGRLAWSMEEPAGDAQGMDLSARSREQAVTLKKWTTSAVGHCLEQVRFRLG
jgi:hypothetical protein